MFCVPHKPVYLCDKRHEILSKLWRDYGRCGMSILYLISLLFTPWYEKTVCHNIAHALFCIADALWVMAAGKIFGWW